VTGLGLRVGIKKTGCSGFAYVVNYADEIHPEDAVFEARGVKVVVDAQSLPLIDGTTGGFRQAGSERGVQVPKPESQGRMRLRRELSNV
jgi:iron-sulfur cluster assembly protein